MASNANGCREVSFSFVYLRQWKLNCEKSLIVFRGTGGATYLPEVWLYHGCGCTGCDFDVICALESVRLLGQDMILLDHSRLGV